MAYLVTLTITTKQHSRRGAGSFGYGASIPAARAVAAAELKRVFGPLPKRDTTERVYDHSDHTGADVEVFDPKGAAEHDERHAVLVVGCDRCLELMERQNR